MFIVETPFIADMKNVARIFFFYCLRKGFASSLFFNFYQMKTQKKHFCIIYFVFSNNRYTYTHVIKHDENMITSLIIQKKFRARCDINADN